MKSLKDHEAKIKMITDDDDDKVIVRTAVGGGLTKVGVVTEESHTALAASNQEVSASAVSLKQRQ